MPNLCHAAEHHAKQHGNHVFDVLAARAEPRNRQNSADGWPVERAADEQHIARCDEAVKPHIDQRRAKTAQSDEVRRGLPAFAKNRPQSGHRSRVHPKPQHDKKHKQQTQKRAKKRVVSITPN
ncbi:hypothetical protein SDC9_144193 [bioreactor metagenome]|uniref:Uncharacterized protein n=1 Tax=bioreactor metagenome TaxID=1076179 RepID=A0A645E8R7_9ZZZZ